uniref:Uncharacterized protein n=1 Tax=Candidatus Kentrum sp. TUN TaxID=2126343 RepID=A0A450ZL85_9GAMM|nr:MAG: hypothetical protein BECKTUN1418F_GA0071002_104415 [Candidatus Kentron sp. TUN]VFK57392.1 MAG: hypothetical protein BECKTUN1418E_GA0071001_104515 [Candidatus Kentron sp. TUN]
MLEGNNGGLYCFEHTLVEIESILTACADSLSPLTPSTPYGLSAEYFLSNSISSSDILLYKTQAKENIKSDLGVEVCSTPDRDLHSIDEKPLDEILQKEIRYKNEMARFRDVDSLSAIMRIRKEKKTNHLEDCKAVFVTTNLGLARAARAAFVQKDKWDYLIPPCITDHRLTAHLWLKMPTKSPSLSKKRIIADCYASIQPSEEFWIAFVGEIEKLKLQDNLSIDDYYLLRYDLDVRRHIMEASLGDKSIFENEELFITGTIPELLKATKEEIRKKLAKENEEEAKRNRQKAEEIESNNQILRKQLLKVEEKLEKDNSIRKSRVTSLSNRIAKAISISIEAVLLVALGITSYACLFGTEKQLLSFIPNQLLGTMSFVLLVLTVSNLYKGQTLKSIVSKLEKAISEFVYIRLAKIML